jgi:hypothetical protein
MTPVSLATFIAAHRGYTACRAASYRALRTSPAWFYRWHHGGRIAAPGPIALAALAATCSLGISAGTARRGSPADLQVMG